MKQQNITFLFPQKIINHLRFLIQKHSHFSPENVVKANTKKAFEYFYSKDDYIYKHYLDSSRLALYESIADFCLEILIPTLQQNAIRIADIGCGTGHMLKALSRKIPVHITTELYGLDFASTAISKAKMLLPEATFIAEDILNNNLPSDNFDIVLCIETIEHMREFKKALYELHRICKKGSSMVLTIPNGEKDSWDGHVNFWNEQQFIELLSPYGVTKTKLLQDDTVMAHVLK